MPISIKGEVLPEGKTLCVFVQTTDLNTKEAWELATVLSKAVEDKMNVSKCQSWRTPFYMVTNTDLVGTIAARGPLINIEDK